MSAHPRKTEAGQREFRERSLSLTRAARTLLVLADGRHSDEQLLQMVQGATVTDLATLFSARLLTLNPAEAAPTAPAPLSTSPAPLAPLSDSPTDTATAPPGNIATTTTNLNYRELYDSLNALVKEQLGLFRGYKFSLDIEKADGLDGLCAVAERFVEAVEKHKGDSAAQMVRRALGLA